VSKGVLARRTAPSRSDQVGAWYERPSSDLEARQSETKAAQGKARTKLADRWIFPRPVDGLSAKLQDQLAAEGRPDKARAIRQLMDDHPWTQVRIQGEGRHRVGYLPAGAIVPAGHDPAPVDRRDAWDF
jgi:hypothetical protein